ncbi:hypothetical protein GCM10028827_36680 [Mucilaginibacter myungsuensis]|nr:hypothetical protein [Mucilaginibacter myungsuensis]
MTRTAVAALVFSAIGFSATAQKLPGSQEASLRAPSVVKIDGKLNEWNDALQAQNSSTSLQYSVANDDANLYFVLKSTDQMNNNKIIGGGVNITINTQNKKSDKDAYQVILPVDLKKLGSMMMSMRSSIGANGQPDSAALAGMRKKAVSAFRDINLVNFKGIPDSTLSIYNEYGIKAFVDFDNKGALVMEVAIPLKEMKMDAKSSFNYNIKLPGINIQAMMQAAMSAGAMESARTTTVQAPPPPSGGGGGGFGGFGGGGGIPRNMGDMANMVSPTDFWGKYTNTSK